jgi:hypothetical protein
MSQIQVWNEHPREARGGWPYLPFIHKCAAQVVKGRFGRPPRDSRGGSSDYKAIEVTHPHSATSRDVASTTFAPSR